MQTLLYFLFIFTLVESSSNKEYKFLNPKLSISRRIIVTHPDPESNDSNEEEVNEGKPYKRPEGKENTEKKYYQDKYTNQYEPGKLEFGHILESPHEWEQRFERIDHDKNRRQGQVIWGDADGKYGEQYWDFNNDGTDDGQEKDDHKKEGVTSIRQTQQFFPIKGERFFT